MTQENNTEEVRNPYTGETVEEGDTNMSVGQDDNVNTQENSGTDWESSAKYFQSEKDKLAAENNRLKQYEQLGTLLESRPDVVEAMTTAASGGNTLSGQPAGPKKVQLEEGEFDPWEAYNNPSSKSYKHRVQENQEQINQAVGQAVGGFAQAQQKQQVVSAVDNELDRRGFTPEQKDSFKQHLNQPLSSMNMDEHIAIWENRINKGQIQSPPPNNVDVARNTQTNLPQGGVLQGTRPATKSTDDSIWSGVLGAGRKDVF